MSRHKKLERFAALKTLPNVAEGDKTLKGRWAKDFFKNTNPIVLELACGKGEYCVAMGTQFKDKNFLGLDIKGNRQWVGATQAFNKGLTNVGFLRCFIDHIEEYFEPGEVSEIWITFPDPYLRPSKQNKRLTSPIFLEHYRKVCAPGATLRLKTDDRTLYDFTLQTIPEVKGTILYHTDDLYASPLPDPVLEVKTHYEGLCLSGDRNIKYIAFTL